MEGTAALTMLESIGQGVTKVIAFGGEVVTALLGADGAFKDLLPVIGMGIGFGVVGWGIRTIKSLTWGF